MMKHIDPAVVQETKYVSLCVLVFSVLMQAVFLVLGAWDLTVLWGNLLSGSAAILNFFLMGLSIQSALKKEEKDAKATMKLSQTYRFLFLAIVAILGAVLPCFHLWSVLIPILFPGAAAALRPFLGRKK